MIDVCAVEISLVMHMRNSKTTDSCLLLVLTALPLNLLLAYCNQLKNFKHYLCHNLLSIQMMEKFGITNYLSK